MIKLIVGLGNPGQQYQKNRHNVGFLFLDQLADDCAASWVSEAKFHGLVASCMLSGNKVVLLKPQTFMNRSGLSVGAIARYYKIKIEEVLVVHDELDVVAGACKLKKEGGHAGHNGLRDIIANLSGNGFYRLRMGVGRPTTKQKVADFVLSNPSKAEGVLIDQAFSNAFGQLGSIVSGDMSGAMNRLNKKV